MKTVALVTGGFDPLHSGHLAYLQEAKSMADILVVGVNSDQWLQRKKGRAFMPWMERSVIIDNLRVVDFVIEFDDSDGSARDAIKITRQMFPESKIIFANGGDRDAKNIPEMDVKDDNLEFRFGIGGSYKANSSSWILEEWKSPKTERPWGYYRILYQNGPGVKVKELVVEPGQRLSMQRHQHRAELWFVAAGTATVFTLGTGGSAEHLADCPQSQNIMIHRCQWHQLANLGDSPLKIVEIQYGTLCDETDIERYQLPDM